MSLRGSGREEPAGRLPPLLDFAGLIFFLLFSGGLLYLAYRSGGVDFRSFFAAATVVTRGGNPYDYSQLVPIIERVADAQGSFAFFNPPWIALLFVPLTGLPYAVGQAVWLALSAGIFYTALILLQRELRWQPPGWRRWVAYALFTYVFALPCWVSEQLGTLLFLGLVLLLIGIRRERPWLAAVGVVLLLTKPQSTFLVLLLVGVWAVARWQRMARNTLLLLAGLGIVSSIAIPRWWEIDFSMVRSLTVQLDGTAETATARVNTTLYDLLRYGFMLDGVLLALAALLLLSVAGAALLYVWRRDQTPATLLSTLTLATLLVTPYTLQYDYVILVVPLVVALSRFMRMRSLHRLIVAAILASCCVLIAVQMWSYQGYWILLGVLAAYVIAASTVAVTAQTMRPPAFGQRDWVG